ncbi:MAG: HIT domain-containing protein [Deltaproteobacteria bacterium]|nr:HIT domain-containing protein [Deltaproteobacteria bacterium]MBR5704675.1 HIT domain-containing protein [Deltaproteobacteria bacterium]
MKQLWAPWRMAYIGGETPREEGCVFCVGEQTGRDRERMILKRGRHCFVIMNKYPYSNGHLLIIPYRHTADPEELTSEERLELFDLMVEARAVLKKTMHPDGFNVGINLGRCGGAGVAEHMHIHIVPRWEGDTNFMPVFADVRVIPQHIEATCELLREAFAEEEH